MNEELRQNRLQGLSIRLKQAIINNRHVYLYTVGLQHSWATKEEIDTIARELAASGFCVFIKGRNGADKLMLSGDETRREQAVPNA
jgi:hypothetical protein